MFDAMFIGSDLLCMPTIRSSLVQTAEANINSKRAKNYRNKTEDSSKFKR